MLQPGPLHLAGGAGSSRVKDSRPGSTLQKHETCHQLAIYFLLSLNNRIISFPFTTLFSRGAHCKPVIDSVSNVTKERRPKLVFRDAMAFLDHQPVSPGRIHGSGVRGTSLFSFSTLSKSCLSKLYIKHPHYDLQVNCPVRPDFPMTQSHGTRCNGFFHRVIKQ